MEFDKCDPTLSSTCDRSGCDNDSYWHLAILFFHPNYDPAPDFEFMDLIEDSHPAITSFIASMCKDHRSDFEREFDIELAMDKYYTTLAIGLLENSIDVPRRDTARYCFVTKNVVEMVNRVTNPIMGDTDQIGASIRDEHVNNGCVECINRSALDRLNHGEGVGDDSLLSEGGGERAYKNRIQRWLDEE